MEWNAIISDDGRECQEHATATALLVLLPVNVFLLVLMSKYSSYGLKLRKVFSNIFNIYGSSFIHFIPKFRAKCFNNFDTLRNAYIIYLCHNREN